MSTSDVWRERGREAWSALEDASLCHVFGLDVVHEPGGVLPVALWPFSQVLHAAAVVPAADARAHGLRRCLGIYRSGPAYAAVPLRGRRFYDDNAWIALACIAAGDRSVPLRLMDFLHDGCVSLPDGSVGVRWVEGSSTLHACSTGAAALAAVRLAALAGGRAGDVVLAGRCAEFLLALRDGDGLVVDHRRADGSADDTVHTYNQGLLIGLLAELGRLEEAEVVAARALAAFPPDRLWTHPAAFNAILIRELMTLHRLAPDPRWVDYAETYLSRVWGTGRDARTGLLVGGGMQRYDAGAVLDHAALVTAMLALAEASD